LEWLESAPLEVRAQFARVAGDAGQHELAPLFVKWLKDDSLRIRFFAAQALGALKAPSAVLPLADALRTNADEDVFLRHAIVWAWHRIGNLDAVWALRDDSSRSVRLGVLLALRNDSDARIAVFLDDEDPLLVVEAARAIYDLPLESAMTELAALAASLSPATEEDTQTSQALHRRVIGANVRLRSPAGADALARYVIDESQLESLREIALEALGAYSEPPLRDLTMGFYRPLAAADDEILASVLRSQGRALAESSLGGRAMEIATEKGELPLDDEELVELIGDTSGDLGARVASLLALTSRAEVGQLSVDPAATIEGSLGSDSAALRMAARELRARVAPAAGLTGYVEATKGAETLVERQHAWRMLAGIPGAESERVIAQGLMEWSEGNLEQGVALEVFEAAAGRGGDLEARSGLAMAGGAAASSGDRPVDTRRWALSGGNAELGREIFQTIGDCQRCHGGGGGHGGGVGPALAGVRAKGAEHVLESVLAPNAKIANGFASIVVRRRDGSSTSGLIVKEDASSLVLDIGAANPVTIALDDIVERSTPISGMPPVGLGLSPQALRDVLAYVMTL
jgi:quinoprotein glucose dehydrogenase